MVQFAVCAEETADQNVQSKKKSETRAGKGVVGERVTPLA
jgi:hypothetical protein